MSEDQPSSDVVLLGASNLTRTLPMVVATASPVVGPSRFWIACGHGRSFGLESCVLGRSLPGIVSSGLWADLASAKGGSVHAVITDVGNDILYGQTPQQILEWVQTCVERLSPAKVSMSGLPMDRLAKLTRPGFSVLARTLFPGHQLTYELMQRRVAELQASLCAYAAAQSIAWYEQPARWYGIDPIHIRRRYFAEASGRMLSGWGRDARAVRPKRPLKRAIARSRPQTWQLFGHLKQQSQPCATLADGSLIHRY